MHFLDTVWLNYERVLKIGVTKSTLDSWMQAVHFRQEYVGVRNAVSLFMTWQISVLLLRSLEARLLEFLPYCGVARDGGSLRCWAVCTTECNDFLLSSFGKRLCWVVCYYYHMHVVRNLLRNMCASRCLTQQTSVDWTAVLWKLCLPLDILLSKPLLWMGIALAH